MKQLNHRMIKALIKSFAILCTAFMLQPLVLINAQVITNNGAAISVRPGIFVDTRDILNNSGGRISNNGTISLSGDYTSTSITSGNGTFRIGGNWTNTGGTLSGLNSVIFDGSVNQWITKTGGESFYNLSLENSGAPDARSVIILNNVIVRGTLSMQLGNITATGFKLYLSNKAAASLNYTSTTGSRIFGQFERGVGEAGTYLFPLGTSSNYNPARLMTNTAPTEGSILSEFFISPPGNAGLPLPDPPVEVDSTYADGYWSLTSNNGFSTDDFSVDLDGAGFTDTIRDITRIVKRFEGGDWLLDGTHSDAVGTLVKRNNLSGNISSSGTHFALARGNPLITDHPNDTTVCEDTSPFFTITATGAGQLRYFWYREDGTLITNGPHYSGARTNTLTIIGAVLSDAGNYYCVVRDRYRNTTISNMALLIVNKIPVATVSVDSQDHECSAINFEGIVLGESYGVPGTTYIWQRTNPAGITSSIPMTGTLMNIGDSIPGAFTNTTDAPLTVTFTITPVGPDVTFCVGLPVTSAVTVNPRPRIIPVISEICDSTKTSISLVSPSTMTQPGVIRFDYNITISEPPEVVAGNRDPAVSVAYGSILRFMYSNESDTLHSVFYRVTPTVDALGCPDGVEAPFEVKVHPDVLQALLITTPLTCDGGSDAAMHAETSKGAGLYYFDWFRTPSDQVHGYSIPDLEGRRGGRWNVRVTDNLGCRDSGILRVTGAILDPFLYIPVDQAGFGVTCTGSSDGVLYIQETGNSSGVPPFEYWITRNDQDTASADIHGFLPAKELNDIWTGLPAGKYSAYVRDVNGCYNKTVVEDYIIQPDTIRVTFGTSEYDGDFNVSCKGYDDGSVWISSTTGGNGGYRYKWATSNGTISGIDTLDRLDNITAGTYYLHITDIKGCTETDSITITEPAGMIMTDSGLSVQADGTYNVSCNNGSDGFINMTISGGSGNYTYLWTRAGDAGFTATSEDITGLKAGVYTCTVKDLNGCFLVPSPSFTLTEPAPLGITPISSLAPDGVNNINCYEGTGSVDITVTGGIAGTYEYNWSTADGSGITDGLEDQNSLSAGTYSLTVTDVNGCEKSKDITMKQPDKLEVMLVVKNITCQSSTFDDGSVDLTVEGGSGPYSYLWSDGAISEDITGLTEGWYKVTVTDLNGCLATDSAMVVNPPPLTYNRVLSDYNGYNVSCYGLSNGSIQVTTTSGTAPFIFSWTGPDGFAASTQSISEIRAGIYNLLITDSLNCTAAETIDITEPGQLGMEFTISSSNAGGFNINCAGESTGFIEIEPAYYVNEVEYLWSDGIFSKTRTNLPAGDYTVIITDSNNCYASGTVTLTEPDTMKMSFEVTKPYCPDMPDGSVIAIVTGGVRESGYDYKWSDNTADSTISEIPAGYYSVNVKDMNGCSVRDSLYVEPANETCLTIPNAISPNDDLINDEWHIKNIDLYPQAEIKIFNRWGLSVWKSGKGYPQPWDGRSNGKDLPIDSYHYIIDLHNGTKPVVGSITIVR